MKKLAETCIKTKKMNREETVWDKDDETSLELDSTNEVIHGMQLKQPSANGNLIRLN